MNQEFIPEQGSLLEKWEGALYKLLAAIEEDRDNVAKQAGELYAAVQSGRSSHPDLHQLDVLNRQEGEYWKLQQSIDFANGQMRIIEEALQLLQDGKMSESELQHVISSLVSENPVGQEETKLSKRKQAILREREFLAKRGQSLDPNSGVVYHPNGSNPMHLTTGRHLKKVKSFGNMSSMDAGDNFFFYTADTHGGKVKHGKERYKHKTRGGKSFVKLKPSKKS